MVVALGPGKFYGSSLPRPRIYTDVKFSDERVDPPPPVMDPLMAWAEEAHWSMGGLSFKRLRLQGRIEGKVEKLCLQREKQELFKKKAEKLKKPVKGSRKIASRSLKERNGGRISKTPSPPPAPVAIKRRRVLGLIDEEEEEEERGMRKGPVRKLGEDFERVARESGMDVEKTKNGGGGSGGAVAARTRRKKNETDGNDAKIKKGKKKLVKGGRRIGEALVAAAAGIRTSPRLGKSGGTS